MIAPPKKIVLITNQVKVQIFMTKYNQIFKQQVIDFYFANHENLPKTKAFKHFNLPNEMVRL